MLHTYIISISHSPSFSSVSQVESTHFHKVRELSSVVFLEEFLQAGGRLEKTVDLFGLVGMCVLVHSDPMVLATWPGGLERPEMGEFSNMRRGEVAEILLIS